MYIIQFSSQEQRYESYSYSNSFLSFFFFLKKLNKHIFLFWIIFLAAKISEISFSYQEHCSQADVEKCKLNNVHYTTVLLSFTYNVNDDEMVVSNDGIDMTEGAEKLV